MVSFFKKSHFVVMSKRALWAMFKAKSQIPRACKTLFIQINIKHIISNLQNFYNQKKSTFVFADFFSIFLD